MRNLRLSLIGTVILVLGGSAAMAQEPESSEEPATASAPIVVTGTLDCDADADATDALPVASVHEWAASDPRLAGEATYSGRWQLYDEPQEESGDPAASDAALYSIVNEGGSWLCEASRAPEQPIIDGDRHTLVFNGEGEYEGLTAYLTVDWSQAPYVFSGLILPGEEPPYAEPQG